MRVRSSLALLLLASFTPLSGAFSTLSTVTRSHVGSRARASVRATRLDFEHELEQAWEAAHPTLDQSSAAVGDGLKAGLPVSFVVLETPTFVSSATVSRPVIWITSPPSPRHSGRAPPAFS